MQGGLLRSCPCGRGGWGVVLAGAQGLHAEALARSSDPEEPERFQPLPEGIEPLRSLAGSRYLPRKTTG